MKDGEMSAAERDPYRKSIGARLQHAARLHRSLVARKLATIGLYPGQEQVLKLLAVEPDGTTMGDLASILRVRPPTASKTIGRLAAQGLVERKAAGGDGRLVKVCLTDSGREKATAIDDIWFAAEDELIAEMDGKERKRLRKLLRRVEKALGNHDAGLDDEDDADTE